MKVIAIASGGMDSATLLFHLRRQGHEVCALGVNYGQRHSRELSHLGAFCVANDFDYSIADLSALRPLIAGSSSQTNPEVEVPEGHYADETMRRTVVPNRNMILLAIGIGHAISEGATAVAYGAHDGDHAIYPDCRPEFASAMHTAALLCDWNRIEILRPFIGMDKTAIAELGASLGVPFDLTWTCYKGEELHCGVCGSCTERREAFALSGVPDPTVYAP